MQKPLGLLLTVFIIGKFVSLSAFATNQSSCLLSQLFLIDRPSPIERYPTEMQSHELLEAGEIVSDPARLKGLADNVYVYLIDSNGQMIFSPRTPDLNANPQGRHLATHRSLLERLRKNTNQSLQILGAGEFVIRNGKVPEVSNRAGTFRGTKEHLDFSVKALKSLGLQIENGSLLKDFSKEKPKPFHLKEAEISALLLTLGKTLEYQKLLELERKLSAKFPHPQIPGLINKDWILDRITQFRRKIMAGLRHRRDLGISLDDREISALNNLAYLVKHIQEEGPVLILKRVLDPHPSGRSIMQNGGPPAKPPGMLSSLGMPGGFNFESLYRLLENPIFLEERLPDWALVTTVQLEKIKQILLPMLRTALKKITPVTWKSQKLKPLKFLNPERARSLSNQVFEDPALQAEIGNQIDQLGGPGSPAMWDLYFKRGYNAVAAHSDGYLRIIALADQLLPKEGLIVDLGIGTGNFSAALLAQAHGRKILGVDISPTAIQTAQNLLQQATQGDSSRFSLHQWNLLEALPQQDGKAAAALMNNVLYAMGSRDAKVAALKRAHAYLKEGGVLLLNDPKNSMKDPANLKNWIGELAASAAKNQSPMTAFDVALLVEMNRRVLVGKSISFSTEAELIELTSEAGFELIPPVRDSYDGATTTLLLRKK